MVWSQSPTGKCWDNKFMKSMTASFQSFSSHYNKPSLMQINWGRSHPDYAIMWISEAKDSPKSPKNLRTQINGKCNDIMIVLTHSLMELSPS
jgi:hypothetical protein